MMFALPPEQRLRSNFLVLCIQPHEGIRQHPETVALKKAFGGGRDPNTNYFNSSNSVVIGQNQIVERLYAKEM